MEFLTGILLIVLGFIAMALPIATSMAVVFVLGWAFVIAGVAHLFAAFRAATFGEGVMRAIVGVAYLVVAFAVLQHPAWSVASLALVVSAAFVVEGIVTIAVSFAARDRGVTGWLLFSGVITLLLGFVLWSAARTAPAAIVSALVGLNFVSAGTGSILVAAAIRRITRVIGG